MQVSAVSCFTATVTAEDSWYSHALAGCGRRCATLFCRVARCVPTSTQRQLRQYGGLDFPHKVLLLTVPGGFYWSVPRESWCSFPLVFSHREQCSSDCVTTVLQAEWFWYLRLTVEERALSQCSSREVVLRLKSCGSFSACAHPGPCGQALCLSTQDALWYCTCAPCIWQSLVRCLPL